MSREKQNTPTNTNLHQPCESVQDDADDIGYLLLLTGLSLDTVYPDDCEKIGQILYNAGYRKQEWISVDERLPDNYRAVLVSCEGTTIGGGTLRAIGSYGGGFWSLADADGTMYLTKYMRYIVTHWMELPKPPKMKGGAE